MTTKNNRRRCPDCNRVITKANRSDWHDSDCCDDCFHAAGLYNEHQDGHHEDAPVEGCEGCGYEIADRSKPSNDVKPHRQGSHAHCYAGGAHDKTRAGRAECRRKRGDARY